MRLRDRLRSWMTRQARVSERNKQTVKSFFNAISAGSTEPAFALIADNATWWMPGDLPVSGGKTKDQYLATLTAISAEFPDGLTYTVHGLTAESDRVAAEVVSTGTHLNGKAYNNNHHFLFTVRDGQILAVNEYMDTKHLHDLVS